MTHISELNFLYLELQKTLHEFMQSNCSTYQRYEMHMYANILAQCMYLTILIYNCIRCMESIATHTHTDNIVTHSGQQKKAPCRPREIKLL